MHTQPRHVAIAQNREQHYRQRDQVIAQLRKGYGMPSPSAGTRYVKVHAPTVAAA